MIVKKVIRLSLATVQLLGIAEEVHKAAGLELGYSDTFTFNRDARVRTYPLESFELSGYITSS